ncbi:acyl-CoA dehydratase activase [Oceanidesulfovibrio marinus]|uniref:CoA protein activase n=1 Tax=Oceanidesulfovibrio marinus TaxID=370038 RepID=A0A6P1ZAP5_9BACT|nr:acyl-CoA dehydratase activase [Oceanidesulfovibrio marinus]QJT10425.1 CoA protein activase [Oceanidesulfovibrio marinus]TVM30671.1 CoA protein activase [Oceanidesulfovibrio marinus]
MSHVIGLDAGSVSVKVAVLDSEGAIVETSYERHFGRPLEKFLEILPDLLSRYPDAELAFTGTSGKYVASRLHAPHVNELLAHAAATMALYPEVETIVEMGGEDSKCIFIKDGAIDDFALNSVCAAGTGSFLDQQAERLRLTIEEFSDLAYEYLTNRGEDAAPPPRIAGRCSVFAKSDMIHLQQIATGVEAIVAGLCFSVARNFQGSIVRNRKLRPRVAFMGGVARNKGMVTAFSEVLGEEDLLIPEHVTAMGAIGSAMKAMEEGTAVRVDDEKLRALKEKYIWSRNGLEPLVGKSDDFAKRHLSEEARERLERIRELTAEDGEVDAYLGIDIGSISTCLALIDEKGNLLAKRYLRTAGRPIEAVRQGLREIGEEIANMPATVRISGVGTTGSGRYMIADFVGADVVKNEITAQAMGAVHMDPKVDTIFEIGGQDSKYIQLRDGIITDFEMNKACAAGTGSFLEEQAEKLDIHIKDEFAELALAAESPCRLGERCTVFMENSLRSSLQQGANKDEVLAGLAYSIVENYINRVVSGRAIGENVFFQGGTAFNKAVVAAFEKFLGLQVTVPPHHDNTGAIGMGLIARDVMRENPGSDSRFKGLSMAEREYSQSSFECKGCENHCEINRIRIEGEKNFLFYGGRCEKYDIRRGAGNDIEDLFAFRVDALHKPQEEYAARHKALNAPARRGVIGIPRVFFFHDFMPYYTTLLWELGFEVVISPLTSPPVVGLGVKATLADTCFPVKAALGHVVSLVEQGVNTIFLPSFTNMATPEEPYPYGHACPLTQSFPYQVRAGLSETLDPEIANRIVTPVVRHKYGTGHLHQELFKALGPLGVASSELKRAMGKAQAAQDAFRQSIQDKGREVLSHVDEDAAKGVRSLVVVGRPYNAFDMGMNLEIPKKLATLNVQAIPMDFLPDEEIYDDWPGMYWRSGQRILRAGRFVHKTPHLNALFIGNFSCGPDSFIQPYFDQEMAGKPYLHIEIDEHSADAGVITRCEAFLDSLEMQARMEAEAEPVADSRPLLHDPLKAAGSRVVAQSGRGRTVFIPRMCDHAVALKAAFAYCGMDAEVLPETSDASLSLGRKHVTGKECYPFALTTGDILTKASSPDFKPDKSAFLMWGGTGPCRFGQYNLMQRLIMNRNGLEDVPLFSPVQDSSLYSELGAVGKDFSLRCWQGLVLMDLLTKVHLATRAYEKVEGSADELHTHIMSWVVDAMKAEKPDFPGLMKRIGEEFSDLRDTTAPKKPVVGVLGEIYVRSNRYANEDLVRSLERLGAEIWLTPIDEWVLYLNWCAQEDAHRMREFGRYAKLTLKDFFQKRIGKKIEHQVSSYAEHIYEPDIRVVLDYAMPYLHHSFRGEAVLSVGKALDMIERNAAGVVNAIPFGCMPGTVVTGILRTITSRTGAPTMSIPFDGTASPTMQLQLEAFMDQAWQRHERQGGK